MQPETIKQNGQKKQPTPIEQWDILAAKVISQELAPKGFKKLTSGSYRGLEIANHSTPGITKATVRKCQSIGVGLVRGFREKLRNGFTELSKSRRDEQEMILAELKACSFWQFKKRRQLSMDLDSAKAQEDAFEVGINLLNGTDIK